MDETKYEKDLHTGNIYYPTDMKLVLYQMRCVEIMHRFNKTSSRPLGLLRRMHIMKKMLAEVGKECYIEPPFYANFGGKHVHFGNGVYANFGLTCVDDTHIYVGDHTMIGPNCTLCTAAHPVSPALREEGYQYNLPVRIGKNCWLGANVTVLPGVTIGDNSIIGAGSLVNKDIPANVIAVGSPAKVMRKITEEDDKFYRKTMPIPPELLKK